MKQIKTFLIISILTLGLFSMTNAQRRSPGGERGARPSGNISQSRVERSPQRTFNNSAAVGQMRSNNRSVRIATASTSRTSPINNNSTSRVSSSPSRNNPVISSNNNASRINQQNAFNRANVLRSTTERNQLAIESQRNTRTSREYTPSTGTVNQDRNYDRNPGRGNNNYTNNTYRNNTYRNNSYRNGSAYRNNNNYRYNPRYNYRNNNYYYRSGYNRPIYFMYGSRYSYRPYNSISVYFGGYPYYYSDGLFYDYYGGYYQPIYPPFGIRISRLPFGYSRIYVGLNPFFYFNGIFYRQYEDNYEVVDAPMGATVSSLPSGAKSVVINGEKFYELNGTYFKEDRNSKGKKIYVVVGKNGEINNTNEGDDESGVDYPQSNLQNGDVISQLPEGSKVITLNGEKLYVTPDDTYFKEEVEGDVVQYRVVGK